VRAKEFIVESYPKRVSPDYIAALIDNIHTGSVTIDDEEMAAWIENFDIYELTTIPISDLSLEFSGLNNEKVDSYIDRNNPPPIVIDGTAGWIIDGYHRANAAARRGDKVIRAYVGKYI
jgi:hypothetical protein